MIKTVHLWTLQCEIFCPWRPKQHQYRKVLLQYHICTICDDNDDDDNDDDDDDDDDDRINSIYGSYDLCNNYFHHRRSSDGEEIVRFLWRLKPRI